MLSVFTLLSSPPLAKQNDFLGAKARQGPFSAETPVNARKCPLS